MSPVRSDWIGHWLGVWVTWVLAHRRLVLVASALAGVAGFGYARGHLGINTDTADMISPDLAWRQDFIAYRHAFPIRDRNLLVVIDGPDESEREAFAVELAKRLAAAPGLYESVYVVGGGEFFERNGLLYLSLPELEALSDRLTAAQPLLGRLERGLSGTAVIDLAGEAFARRARARSTREDAGPTDALFAALAGTLDAAARGEHAPLAWRRLLAPEATTGAATERHSMLVIQPLLEFNRARPAARAIERLRDEIAALGRAHPAVVARLTGTVAMEHEELTSVAEGAALAGVLALAMVIAVLFLTLRSLVLLGLAVATLVLGLICTAAFAAFAVGHLNLLSVAFAVLYVGLGVDFILHIGLRLKELLAEGLACEPAIVESVRSVGRTLSVCAITTAAGFYSFIPTPFRGVSELGLISGTGMFVSLFASVTVLPALLAVCYRGRERPSVRAWPGARLLAPVSAHPRLVVAVSVLIGTAALASLPSVRFDHNPVHLRDPNTESVATLRDLAATGDALPFDLAALAPDPATANDWAHALAALPEVAAARTIDSLVPSEQQEKRALLDDLELALGPGFASPERVASDSGELSAALGELAARLERSTASSASSRALSAALGSLETKLARAPPDDRERMLRALDDDLVAGLPTLLERLAKGLRATPFTRADLPPEMTERWIGTGGEALVEISPRENTDDNAAATRFVAAVRTIVPHVTGLPVVNQEASRTVIEAFRLAFAYALVSVLVILLATGLGPKDALLVLGPVVLGAIVTGGATVWLGLDFNFANIIALPLLLGIGVDNGIHILGRMRREAEEGQSIFATSTSKAVLASGVTTIASFGNLAFSSHLGMASMGELLTLGVIVTLAASLVTLPALLRLVERQ